MKSAVLVHILSGCSHRPGELLEEEHICCIGPVEHMDICWSNISIHGSTAGGECPICVSLL